MIALPFRNHSPAVEIFDEDGPTILHLTGVCGHAIQLDVSELENQADVEQAILLAEELPCGACKRRREKVCMPKEDCKTEGHCTHWMHGDSECCWCSRF